MASPVPNSCCVFNLRRRARPSRATRDDGKALARASGRAGAEKRTTVFVMYSRLLALPKTASTYTSTTMSLGEAIRSADLLRSPSAEASLRTTMTPPLTRGTSTASLDTHTSFLSPSARTAQDSGAISYPLSPDDHFRQRTDVKAGRPQDGAFSCRKQMCDIIAAVMAATPAPTAGRFERWQTPLLPMIEPRSTNFIAESEQQIATTRDHTQVFTIEDALAPLEALIASRARRRLTIYDDSPCAKKRRRPADLDALNDRPTLLQKRLPPPPAAVQETEAQPGSTQPLRTTKLAHSVASSQRSRRSDLSRRYGIIFDDLAFRPLELDLIKMHDLMTSPALATVPISAAA